jgi:hypothetical protein
MLLSWLRSPKTSAKRPAPYRPALESLDSRILPSGNPHFIKNLVTSSVNDAGALVVDFKESGLPSGAVETITLSTTAGATYAYINNGGNHPNADNKVNVVAQLSTSGVFTADQNGNIVGELTVGPPPSNISPTVPGQTLVLANVSYTGSSLTDVTSGASFDAVPDASRTFFVF